VSIEPPPGSISPLDAVKRYTCLDVPDRHRRLQALCLFRNWPERSEPPLSWDDWSEWPEDNERLWLIAMDEFFTLWAQGKLEVWGYDTRRCEWVSLPAKLGRSLRASDLDWELEILFPKDRDRTLHGVRVAPGSSLIVNATQASATAINADPVDPRSVTGKQRNVHDDASRKNKLETVIKNAAQSWPNKQKRPPISAIVKELIRQRKAQGYNGETLRKILSGTYEPAKRLGISPDW
jgi:hypothetical protein